MQLLALLRANLAPSVRVTTSDAETQKLVEDVIAHARAAWPSVTLDAERFVPHVAQRIPEGSDLRAALSELHTADLHLSCACAMGDPAALSAFQETIVADLDDAIVRGARVSLDDVRQLVLDRLLVSADGPPRIALYRGQGPLRAWVRVAAVRIALNLTGPKREVSLADRAIDAASPAASPELLHLKETYKGELKRSLEHALAQLSSRDRNLLRYSLLDGLAIDDMGALYGVHRATAARWLARARDDLARHTKRDLRERLGVAPNDLESLFRLVDSQFEMSWSLLEE